jgi:hypothetical protein
VAPIVGKPDKDSFSTTTKTLGAGDWETPVTCPHCLKYNSIG